MTWKKIDLGVDEEDTFRRYGEITCSCLVTSIPHGLYRGDSWSSRCFDLVTISYKIRILFRFAHFLREASTGTLLRGTLPIPTYRISCRALLTAQGDPESLVFWSVFRFINHCVEEWRSKYFEMITGKDRIDQGQFVEGWSRINRAAMIQVVVRQQIAVKSSSLHLAEKVQ